MASNWDALVIGNYDIVMPLTWRSKFGILYLYQPAFSQQLGIFSHHQISNELVEEFLNNIPAKFRYWAIALNAENSPNTYKSKPGKNYLLQLSQPYKNIAEQYNRNTNRNIRKAIEAGINISDNTPFTDTITLHRKRFNDSIGANDDDYKRLQHLFQTLFDTKAVFSVCAKNKRNIIIASSTYVLHKNRIIFLINGNLQESLETGATHLLKDYVIQKFSGSNMIMDFEGSDYARFAQFYEQFGAKQVEYYPIIINNKLPWPIKYLKRSAPAL